MNTAEVTCLTLVDLFSSPRRRDSTSPSEVKSPLQISKVLEDSEAWECVTEPQYNLRISEFVHHYEKYSFLRCSMISKSKVRYIIPMWASVLPPIFNLQSTGGSVQWARQGWRDGLRDEDNICSEFGQLGELDTYRRVQIGYVPR